MSRPGKGGEVQLTDALKTLSKKEAMYAYEFEGRRSRKLQCVLLFSYQAETFLVPMRLGDTPVPIPNTTVKTQSADGTALETVWESRWAPDQKKTTGWKPDEDKTGIGK